MSLALQRRRLVINWRRVTDIAVTILAVSGYIIAIATWIWWHWYTGGPS